MRRPISSILFAAALLMLSACGPMYQTDYQIVPPPTETGRMCANNCLLSRQNCQQSCTIQSNQCDQINRLDAERDYNEYVRRRTKEGKEIKRSLSSFSGNACNEDYDCEERCESNFHLCHTNCGGQVIPHTYCAANCQQ